jgi:glycosyltransferase involved in cell wall biosynthesis
LRILIVGPDACGSIKEPLTFKGILEIRHALEMLSASFNNFTAVRMSAGAPEIFRNFPCEYYRLPDDEMKTFLFGASDLLVYASHYDSCPRPPLEAMASGTAVICTETDGAREYCRDGENCLLVPIKSPDAIAAALKRLISDTLLRENLVRGGLATADARPQRREWDELEAFCYDSL